MQDLISTRIEQVKSLHNLCVEGGLEPSFTLEQFQSGIDDLKATGSISDLNRFVLMHHKMVHELLYAPPRRS